MSPLPQLASIAVLLSVAGCSSVGDSTLATAGQYPAADSPAPAPRYVAAMRVNKYADERKHGNPRLLGISTLLVRGVRGNQLLLDQDMANLVTTEIKNRFAAEGYQVLEGSAASDALFEVSGVIKDFTLNVKNRDEINIAIGTTVKDLRSGAALWSGLVTEKSDRFAGVSGNNKDDVVAYMYKGLRVVTRKTVEAASASLMASQPGLFNLTPGARAIPGVTVHVAPAAIAPGDGAQPDSTSVSVPLANAGTGLLLVNTTPSRARVYLDGVYYGMSPLRLEMEPGVYTVLVKLNNYKAETEKVSVRKGDRTEMELSLER
ncbi:MAG: PEGA domain-containing protein [Gallionella sp.]|nr:PEGA domain-containing protein [Gallionella sp.]